MAEYKSFQERFDWLLGFMAIDDPFTHELLMILRREETTEIPTMGVSVDGTSITLGYNRKFVESLSDKEIRGTFSHEMYHLALHHCTTRCPTDKALRLKHNVAADLAINSLFNSTANKNDKKDEYKCLPKCALLPEKYGFPEMLSLEQYYGLLPDSKDPSKGGGKGDKGDKDKKKDKQKGKGDPGAGDPEDGDQPGGGGDQKDGDQEGSGGNGDSQDGDQEGSGGSGDPKDGDQEGKGHGGFDCHDGWSNEDNQIADEIIRQKIREMENSDRYWGNMPGDVKQMILAAQKSRISWHKLLRYMYGMLTSKNAVHTFKRPNRRFGYPYTGFKKDCIERTLLLWDLSGSVHDHEVSKFLSETNRVAEVQPVDVQMFDHQLQGKIIPFSRKLKKIGVTGRGGTSFEEPFALADKMHYGTVICFTDGAAAPIPKPKHVKNIIWAIVGGGHPPVKWGRVLNIDTINGKPIPE